MPNMLKNMDDHVISNNLAGWSTYILFSDAPFADATRVSQLNVVN